MDMKLKKMMDGGEALHQLDINRWVVHDIIKDLNHQKQKSMLNRSFEVYFFKFVNVFLPLYTNVSDTQHTILKLSFMSATMKSKPQEFVEAFTTSLNEPERTKIYDALFQSALIYAAAGAYGAQIRHIYMQAKNKPEPPTEQQKLDMLLAATVGSDTIDGKYLHGTTEDAAQYSDGEYAAYMDKTHPLLATFVRTKNRFKYKQVLAVMCYLTNPKLEKEY